MIFQEENKKTIHIYPCISLYKKDIIIIKSDIENEKNAFNIKIFSGTLNLSYFELVESKYVEVLEYKQK